MVLEVDEKKFYEIKISTRLDKIGRNNHIDFISALFQIQSSNGH